MGVDGSRRLRVVVVNWVIGERGGHDWRLEWPIQAPAVVAEAGLAGRQVVGHRVAEAGPEAARVERRGDLGGPVVVT